MLWPGGGGIESCGQMGGSDVGDGDGGRAASNINGDGKQTANRCTAAENVSVSIRLCEYGTNTADLGSVGETVVFSQVVIKWSEEGYGIFFLSKKNLRLAYIGI